MVGRFKFPSNWLVSHCCFFSFVLFKLKSETSQVDDEDDATMCFLSPKQVFQVFLLIFFLGDKHELLPAEDNKPGIVVHICEDIVGPGSKRIGGSVIAQTPCPKRN